MSCIKLLFLSSQSNEDAEHLSIKTTKQNGQSHCFDCSPRKIAGLIALVISLALVILAAILASGVFGGGKLAFVAGALTIVGMVGFGMTAYLFLTESPEDSLQKTLSRIKKASSNEA